MGEVIRAASAAIVNPIIVIAGARVGGGESISERRIVIASVAYAIPITVVFVLTGCALRKGTRVT